MTISRPDSIESEVVSGADLSEGTLAYFRARLRNRLFEAVLKEFISQSESTKFSRADLAKRLRKNPSQITRWLSSPGNWTLNTASDLLVAMGQELGISVESIADSVNATTGDAKVVYMNSPAQRAQRTTIKTTPATTNRDTLTAEIA